MTSPSLNLVQETAIEKILEDHLWNEIFLLREKSKELMKQVSALDTRRKMFEEIASVAGIDEPPTNPES